MILIEQQAEDVKLSFEFQMNAEVDGIRLVSANIHRNPDFILDETNGILTSGVTFKPGDRKREKQSVTLAVDFDFRIWWGEKGRRDLARVRCRFDADYELRPGFEPSEQQISAFHHGNAIFNCWPYFREFIQSAIVRMSLPPPTVPFLRLVPKPNARIIDAEGTKAIEAPPSKPAKKKKPR